MRKEKQDIIDRFFSVFCPSHAIPRINEALFFKTVKLKHPVLDLGCGDGKFALLVFGKKAIDAGLDLNPKEAEKARSSGAYKKVFVSDGNKMPFKNSQFESVISNSVLEHMDDLESVLVEVKRVLKKRGTFVFTVPTPLVSKYQFWSKFIPGWPKLKERLWHHVNYFGEEKWREKMRKTGFTVTNIKKTNSKKAISCADIFFPIFWLGPIRPVQAILKKEFFAEAKDGATLLVTAQKI